MKKRRRNTSPRVVRQATEEPPQLGSHCPSCGKLLRESAANFVGEVTRERECMNPECPEAPEHYKRVPEREKDPAAVSLGRRGGLKGGKARAAKLSPERRSEIARNAAKARWAPG